MGYKVTPEIFNELLKRLSRDFTVYAPRLFAGGGAFSDTDIVRYGAVERIEEIEFKEKSKFSFKEALLPLSQTLFFFQDTSTQAARLPPKGTIVFLRSCELHAVKRLDEMYLYNGPADPYYRQMRDKTKFVLIGCAASGDNCFCVSMGTNRSDNYDAYVEWGEDGVLIDCKWDDLADLLRRRPHETAAVEPAFVTENRVTVRVPDRLPPEALDWPLWREYDSRCIGCGRCNFVCPTCTCFTMQDIAYQDNGKVGERRRVWASCQVDGFTNMAGGHSFRKEQGQRTRFKALHKIYDYKQRFGYHMCVGCGRCDDICPEYISFSHCVNRLYELAGKEE